MVVDREVEVVVEVVDRDICKDTNTGTDIY